jgi:acetyl esterase
MTEERVHRTLDPQTQALLDKLAAARIPEWHTLSVPDARRIYLERAALVACDPEPVAHVEDRRISGPDGPVGVRIYRSTSAGPLPVLVYLHGGGWVLGNCDTCDPLCRALANAAPCVVVSVDYRLAPEHKFPAAHRDSFATTEWAIANAAALGGDPTRVVVGGDSAGGNLSAAVALQARDQRGPRLAGQLLIYPALDYSFDTLSYRENAKGFYLSRTDVMWFWDHYLPNDAAHGDPYACPLRSTDLSGLPAAAVITTEFDPLRDEAEMYAARLIAAGVSTWGKRYPGTTHGFMAMATELDIGKRGIEDAARWLRFIPSQPR